MSRLQFVSRFILIMMIIVSIAAAWDAWQVRLKNLCTDHGYTEWKVIGLKGYCIGVRNGNKIIVPIEELDQ